MEYFYTHYYYAMLKIEHWKIAALSISGKNLSYALLTWVIVCNLLYLGNMYLAYFFAGKY